MLPAHCSLPCSKEQIHVFAVSFKRNSREGGSLRVAVFVFTTPIRLMPLSSEYAISDERKVNENVQFTWKSAIFTCCVGGFCIWYYDYLKDRKESESRAITTQERIGVPRLGGAFELVDRKGKTVTDKDFLGQYLLIYFGFTFCPDICPQEMEKQTRAIEMLEAEFGPIATPVFISVDPKRDLPAIVDDYCKEFHPRIVGLTGTPEQIKKVSRAYRVYYNEGLKTDDADYLVDHSIIHYFIGKNGKFLDFFGKNMTAKEMADKMRGYIRQDQESTKQRKQRRGVESTDEE
ncbi:SCO1 [Symbiodinium microadriaticum]|nr:SCO1 [Symbiodinium microadriaticum]